MRGFVFVSEIKDCVPDGAVQIKAAEIMRPGREDALPERTEPFC